MGQLEANGPSITITAVGGWLMKLPTYNPRCEDYRPRLADVVTYLSTEYVTITV